LAGEHARQVEADVADLDAVVAEPRAGQGVQLAGVEQRLAGDAADVQARAAQGSAFVDARHLHPQLRGADRRHVAARAGTDHYQVVTLCHVLGPWSLVPGPWSRIAGQGPGTRDQSTLPAASAPGSRYTLSRAPGTAPPRGRRSAGGRTTAPGTSS